MEMLGGKKKREGGKGIREREGRIEKEREKEG
jgi:hypothetical protein